MKISTRTVAAVSSTALLLFLGAAGPANQNTFVHAVAKGETVSFLCIKYYGYYNAQLNAAWLKDNPAVKDINLISVGQKLTFHKPSKAGEPADTSTPDAALFEEKLDATQGVVTYVEGSAFLLARGVAARQALTPNVVVGPGDVVETGKGRAELIINRESVVRLKENTRLSISALRDNAADKGKTKLGFSLGGIWTKVKKFKDRIARFELQLPTAIAGVHGTVYETSVNADSTADVKVFDGEVDVENRPAGPAQTGGPSEVSGPQEVSGPTEVSMEQWTQIVRNMQQLHIGKKGKPDAPKSFTENPKDSWETWNKERDRKIAEMFLEM